jgi:UDP-N-acetylglucosamine--N-acetylmuramyl-(pentapeptide) pyrophosphoryl-undecaprenol N-acetylglucosamine transferase
LTANAQQKTEMETILLAAGGTGGHIYPAAALAKALRELAPNLAVDFVCGNRPAELQLYRRLEIQPFILPLGPSRPGLTNRARLSGQFAASFFQSRRILRQRRPRVAVGFGSYVSVAPLLAARVAGARLVLHEQNIRAGAANRALAPLAAAVGVAHENTRGLRPRRRLRVVGNPIRPEVLRPADRAEARRWFRLGAEGLVCLVMGGSQGAQGLNRLLLHLLERTHDMESPASAWQFLWSTGPAHYEEVMRSVESMGRDPHEHGINPYIDEMARAYAAADLVVARAGALTIAELTARGLPAILVPLPIAGGHQRDNARALEEAGAAAVVEQNRPDAVIKLEQALGKLATSSETLKGMAQASKSRGRPDAAERLARLVLEFMPNQGA